MVSWGATCGGQLASRLVQSGFRTRRETQQTFIDIVGLRSTNALTLVPLLLSETLRERGSKLRMIASPRVRRLANGFSSRLRRENASYALLHQSPFLAGVSPLQRGLPNLRSY
ncbi:MAG: hypothetical protein PUP91_14685 [Rhizonema sp. PD37]|nr:hypothetical protein [Rhizonema sp. PD37]